MEMEFGRVQTWTDWKGVSYTLQQCWQYVTGAAEERSGCTPGIQDKGNIGMTLDDFRNLINKKIEERRLEGWGTDLAETYAFLTREEVLSIRFFLDQHTTRSTSFCGRQAFSKGGVASSSAAT